MYHIFFMIYVRNKQQLADLQKINFFLRKIFVYKNIFVINCYMVLHDLITERHR